MPDYPNKAVNCFIVLSQLKANSPLVEIFVTVNISCFLKLYHLGQSGIGYKFGNTIQFYFYDLLVRVNPDYISNRINRFVNNSFISG